MDRFTMAPVHWRIQITGQKVFAANKEQSQVRDSLSIVRKISGIGFQPVGLKSQARSLCHNEESTVIFRSMLSGN